MQNGNITLKDNLAASVILTPELKEGLRASYHTIKSGVVRSLWKTCAIVLRPGTVQAPRKVQVKHVIPYVVTTPGTGLESTKFATAFVDYLIPEDAPDTTAAELRARVAASATDALIIDVIDNGAFPY